MEFEVSFFPFRDEEVKMHTTYSTSEDYNSFNLLVFF